MAKKKIPELKEWVNPTQVGEILGISRQTAHRWMKTEVFDSVHRIGAYYVVRREEVMAKKRQRKAA